jgi:hypothetical protein
MYMYTKWRLIAEADSECSDQECGHKEESKMPHLLKPVDRPEILARLWRDCDKLLEEKNPKRLKVRLAEHALPARKLTQDELEQLDFCEELDAIYIEDE